MKGHVREQQKVQDSWRYMVYKIGEVGLARPCDADQGTSDLSSGEKATFGF